MISQMINEPRDSISYGYATGWAHLHAVADRVSVLARKDTPTDADRDRIHDHLRDVFRGLDRLYGEDCDRLAVGCDEKGYYCRTYSDGSPVDSSASPAEQFPSHGHKLIHLCAGCKERDARAACRSDTHL